LILITNRKWYELSIGTKIGDLDRVTLNGVMALIFCYFTEFVYDMSL